MAGRGADRFRYCASCRADKETSEEMGDIMEFGLGFVAGAVLSGLWTAWVTQRALNRQQIIPTPIKKAKVFSPTEIDREAKKYQDLRRAVKKRQKEREIWDRGIPTIVKNK